VGATGSASAAPLVGGCACRRCFVPVPFVPCAGVNWAGCWWPPCVGRTGHFRGASLACSLFAPVFLSLLHFGCRCTVSRAWCLDGALRGFLYTSSPVAVLRRRGLRREYVARFVPPRVLCRCWCVYSLLVHFEFLSILVPLPGPRWPVVVPSGLTLFLSFLLIVLIFLLFVPCVFVHGSQAFS